MASFDSILDLFEDFSILAEKQQLRPRKLDSLKNLAELTPYLTPQVTRLVEGNESGVKNTLCSEYLPKVVLI